jgi:aspartyl-tRNA(Asn)/glutamyl-tRNA(Gln) amidotransferase subunit A
MPEISVPFSTISELSAVLRAGELSSVELTQQLFERIENMDTALHAFVTVTRERALEEAEAADRRFGRGEALGPVDGIPFAAKDIFDVKGHATTAGTRLLDDNIATQDCTVVRKLTEAGMVLLGKTHTVQFACDITGLNHDYGTPHNPWHQTHHVPGGSSSGSAVSVAAGFVPMALGSDTAGSIRVPAALCGTVGLKPTVGRISRAGVYPLCWTFDSVGSLTHSVEDAALVHEIIQGPDSYDDATFLVKPKSVLQDLKKGVAGLDIVFGESVFFDEVDPEVEKAVREAGKMLQSLGARVASKELPEVIEAQDMPDRFNILATEAYSVNRRFIENHRKEIDPLALYMENGKNISAPEYFMTLRKRADLKRRLLERLGNIDAILVPTAPIPAKPTDIVDESIESCRRYTGIYLRNTKFGNFFDLCGISVPCGFTNDGFPIGLMIYARPFHEEVALRIGHAYERATNWHSQHPDLSWIG